MTEANDISPDAAEALARMLGLRLDASETPKIVDQLRLAADMAAKFADFPMPNDAEPAPVFTP